MTEDEARTTVTIEDGDFHVDGRPTYEGRTFEGSTVEGLLFNSRMVQALFDDENPETVERWAYPDTGEWDPERNVREFVAALPTYYGYGLGAVTVNLQCGSPEGYSETQPWVVSAYDPDGSLKPAWLDRLERVLDAADDLGMVVVLGLFYFGQDGHLTDESAVKRAVDNAVGWLHDHGYRNVVVEVNNECDINYDHDILGPERVPELVERVRDSERDGWRYPAGTSFSGGTVPTNDVVAASDVVLVHGNGVDDPDRIRAMVAETRALPGYDGQPIVCNEDDHFAFDAPDNNLRAAVEAGASWGYFDPGEGDYEHGFQSVPVNWGLSTERKRAFFETVAETTGFDA
ncbi:MAG: hypothetical protein V5A44_00165 [Haloarculaceae archaeon]